MNREISSRSTIVAAAVAMGLVAALGVANAAYWATTVDVRGSLRDTAEITGSVVSNGLIEAIGIPLVWSALYAGLAVPVLRGRQWARVLTMVTSGLLLLLCGSCGVGSVWLTAAETPGPADPSPSWRDHYVALYAAASVVLLATVLVLLALPSVSRYVAAREARRSQPLSAFGTR